jgi:hypothetical protein
VIPGRRAARREFVVTGSTHWLVPAWVSRAGLTVCHGANRILAGAIARWVRRKVRLEEPRSLTVYSTTANPTIASTLRTELLRLAKQEEDIAAAEAALVHYWESMPLSVSSHRQCASVLRRMADQVDVTRSGQRHELATEAVE